MTAQDLPLPVAQLLRAAQNAKSPRDRHDSAYWAWEVSIRLAVFAHAPTDMQELARASIGTWVSKASLDDDPRDNPALLAAYQFLSRAALERNATPEHVTPRRVLGLMPAYRNKFVGGHGARCSPEFYEEATPVLVNGIRAAWASRVFWPTAARLVFVESVWRDEEGFRARLLSLHGQASTVLTPTGSPVAETTLPNRVCLERAGAITSLYPFVLYQGDETRESLLLFNGVGRRARYLDYISGQHIAADALKAVAPGVEEALLERLQVVPDDESEEPSLDEDQFGEYRVLGKLGEGGMGVVYLARQESLGRLVAVKLLPAELARDEVAVARFRREIDALSRCDHPNVVKILASGEARDTHYYAMELIEGVDLEEMSDVLSSDTSFDAALKSESERRYERHRDLFEGAGIEPAVFPRATARVDEHARMQQLARAFRNAASGLHALHEQRVLHRDVKPSNLMLTTLDQRVVVMDLGLAAVTDASRSLTRDRSQLLGTLRYMAPEQLQRGRLEVDRRADVYGLGATFYELFTGHRFLDGDTEPRLIRQILHEEPVPARRHVPGLPRDLERILRKATEKDPRQRYEGAAHLAADLDAWFRGQPISARPPTVRYLIGLWIRRHRAAAGIAAAALLAFAVGSVVFVQSLARERDEANRQRGRAALARDLFIARWLETEPERLWPVEASRAPRYTEWLRRFEELAARIPQQSRRLAALRRQADTYAIPDRAHDHRAVLDELEGIDFTLEVTSAARVQFAGTQDPDIRRALDQIDQFEHEFHVARVKPLAELDKRLSWRFSDPVLQSEYDQLAGAGMSFERLKQSVASLSSLHASMQHRARIALAMDRNRHDDEAFRDALRASGIEDPVPSMGDLVSLGRSKLSGLFEFAHVGSGRIPKRSVETGEVLIEDDTCIVFVLVPGGKHWVGSQDVDPARRNYHTWTGDDERPVHEAWIEPIFVAKTELTWHQFTELTKHDSDSGVSPLVGNKEFAELGDGPRHPARKMSHVGAKLWLERYNLRLPFEWEWEWACHAGARPFSPWTTGMDPATLQGHANLYDQRGASDQGVVTGSEPVPWDDGFAWTAPVASFKPNAWGLYDMHGNVQEITSVPTFQYSPIFLVGTSYADRNGMRGGAFNTGAKGSRTAMRWFTSVVEYKIQQGVRPVRSLDPSREVIARRYLKELESR